jgi:DeoR/GlpR family transcriptional regulator of sugar metabolism
LLSVKELIDVFSVTDQTVRNDLKGLLEKDILSQIPLDNKSNVFGIGKKFEDFIRKAFKEQ